MRAMTIGNSGNYFLRIARDEAQAVRLGELEIVPRCVSLQIGGPRKRNLLVWSRPLSVEVRRSGSEGRGKIVRIRDISRRLELGMAMAAGMILLRGLLTSRRR